MHTWLRKRSTGIHCIQQKATFRKITTYGILPSTFCEELRSKVVYPQIMHSPTQNWDYSLTCVSGATATLIFSKLWSFVHRICTCLLHFCEFNEISSTWFWVRPLCFRAVHAWITIASQPPILPGHTHILSSDAAVIHISMFATSHLSLVLLTPKVKLAFNSLWKLVFAVHVLYVDHSGHNRAFAPLVTAIIASGECWAVLRTGVTRFSSRLTNSVHSYMHWVNWCRYSFAWGKHPRSPDAVANMGWCLMTYSIYYLIAHHSHGHS